MLRVRYQRAIREIELTVRRLANAATVGRYRSAFKGRGMAFSEVRQYQHGDDIRDIDWKVMARTGQPHVRCYEEERELTVLLMVDVSASLSFGTGVWSKRELAALVTGLLALVAHRGRDRVGLLTFAGNVQRFVAPARGEAHALRLIEEVLAETPAASPGSSSDLALALAQAWRALTSTALVFLVSDFLATDYELGLSVAARRHEVVPIRISDPAERPAPTGELPIPAAGLLRLQDPESPGGTVILDSSNTAVRASLAAALHRHRAETERIMRRCNLNLLELSTAGDFEQDMVRFFRRRALTSLR
ncbi:MAG: DUF58 domain-containing protein [Candidatus Schekmanbacteria bacterium]|nr:DUF58 domain-containing protein [Candidatus Schekmanbacteria bacterium]